MYIRGNVTLDKKKIPLCKPFTITTTNGFVVELVSPINETIINAEILELLLKQPHGISSILKEVDVLV